MIKVIPVIDLLNGVVVHAVSGQREEYKPLSNSVITSSSNPIELLKKLKTMGFNEVYIADINAILGGKINDYILEKAIDVGFKVLADIGEYGVYREDSEYVEYVIGTEYISIDELEKLRRRVTSLDIEYRRVKFRNKHYEIAKTLTLMRNTEIRKLLVIFLDLVGTMRGIDLNVITFIRKEFNKELIVGGGIKGVDDILELKNIGVNAVLIATALHKGVITKTIY